MRAATVGPSSSSHALSSMLYLLVRPPGDSYAERLTSLDRATFSGNYQFALTKLAKSARRNSVGTSKFLTLRHLGRFGAARDRMKAGARALWERRRSLSPCSPGLCRGVGVPRPRCGLKPGKSPTYDFSVYAYVGEAGQAALQVVRSEERRSAGAGRADHGGSGASSRKPASQRSTLVLPGPYPSHNVTSLAENGDHERVEQRRALPRVGERPEAGLGNPFT